MCWVGSLVVLLVLSGSFTTVQADTSAPQNESYVVQGAENGVKEFNVKEKRLHEKIFVQQGVLACSMVLLYANYTMLSTGLLLASLSWSLLSVFHGSWEWQDGKGMLSVLGHSVWANFCHISNFFPLLWLQMAGKIYKEEKAQILSIWLFLGIVVMGGCLTVALTMYQIMLLDNRARSFPVKSTMIPEWLIYIGIHNDFIKEQLSYILPSILSGLLLVTCFSLGKIAPRYQFFWTGVLIFYMTDVGGKIIERWERVEVGRFFHRLLNAAIFWGGFAILDAVVSPYIARATLLNRGYLPRHFGLFSRFYDGPLVGVMMMVISDEVFSSYLSSIHEGFWDSHIPSLIDFARCIGILPLLCSFGTKSTGYIFGIMLYLGYLLGISVVKKVYLQGKQAPAPIGFLIEKGERLGTDHWSHCWMAFAFCKGVYDYMVPQKNLLWSKIEICLLIITCVLPFFEQWLLTRAQTSSKHSWTAYLVSGMQVWSPILAYFLYLVYFGLFLRVNIDELEALIRAIDYYGLIWNPLGSSLITCLVICYWGPISFFLANIIVDHCHCYVWQSAVPMPLSAGKTIPSQRYFFTDPTTFFLFHRSSVLRCNIPRRAARVAIVV